NAVLSARLFSTPSFFADNSSCLSSIITFDRCHRPSSLLAQFLAAFQITTRAIFIVEYSLLFVSSNSKLPHLFYQQLRVIDRCLIEFFSHSRCQQQF
ncbi:hypothetical protein PMAYCL1PPCAC_10506, partial [Pristionchus mayeri]